MHDVILIQDAIRIHDVILLQNIILIRAGGPRLGGDLRARVVGQMTHSAPVHVW